MKIQITNYIFLNEIENVSNITHYPEYKELPLWKQGKIMTVYDYVLE